MSSYPPQPPQQPPWPPQEPPQWPEQQPPPQQQMPPQQPPPQQPPPQPNPWARQQQMPPQQVTPQPPQQQQPPQVEAVGQPTEPYRGATAAAIQDWWAGKQLKVPGWGLPDWLISVVLWFVLSIAAAVPLAFAAEGSALFAWTLVIGVILPWFGMGGWPWLVSRLRGNGPVSDFGLRIVPKDIAWGLLFGFGALMAAALVGWLTTLVFGDFDSSAGDLADNLADHPVALIVFALAVGLGAPIVEEVCYRGLLVGGLLKKGMAKWLVIVVSAVLFAAMHMEPVRFPLLLAIGLILGWARVFRNSTTTAVVAHMCNNIPGAIGILAMVWTAQ